MREKCLQGEGDCMLREIYDQPGAVLETLRSWMGNAGKMLGELGLSHRLHDLRRLHIIASGSAYYAGLAGRYIIEKFFHIPVSVDMESEYKYLESASTKGTALIVIERSGNGDCGHGRGNGDRGRDALPFRVYLDEAPRPEDGQGEAHLSVKTFTPVVTALCLLGISLGAGKGKVRRIEVETLGSLLEGLPALIAQALDTDAKIREVVDTLRETRSLLYLGRGINYPIALEGAQMMKEFSHIHADGYSSGEVLHRPASFIEEGMSVVLIAPIESIDEDLIRNVNRLKGRAARIVAVTDAPAALHSVVDDVVSVPACHPAMLPFIMIVPLQLLAYRLSVIRGPGRRYGMSITGKI